MWPGFPSTMDIEEQILQLFVVVIDHVDSCLWLINYFSIDLKSRKKKKLDLLVVLLVGRLLTKCFRLSGL